METHGTVLKKIKKSKLKLFLGHDTPKELGECPYFADVKIMNSRKKNWEADWKGFV